MSYKFLTFRQLYCLAIMIILASTGMVTIEHFALFIFSIFYIFFLAKTSFPNLHSSNIKPVFDQQSNILGIYILFAAIIGLLLPILYIFKGIYTGDKNEIKAAVPHVFLLTSQVFMEGVSVSGQFSLPIRVFVPVFYNSTRMFTLFEWLKHEMIKVGFVGKALAVANLGLWGFNLFGFLLPVYLPRAFKIYYSDNISVVKKD